MTAGGWPTTRRAGLRGESEQRHRAGWRLRGRPEVAGYSGSGGGGASRGLHRAQDVVLQGGPRLRPRSSVGGACRLRSSARLTTRSLIRKGVARQDSTELL